MLNYSSKNLRFNLALEALHTYMTAGLDLT